MRAEKFTLLLINALGDCHHMDSGGQSDNISSARLKANIHND